MTTTLKHEIDGGADWEQVSTGSASVTVQLRSRGPLLLHIGAAKPAADSDVGLILDADGDASFAGNALIATDNCYLRSISGETETVTVVAT